MGIGDPSKGMNKWAVPEEESRKIILLRQNSCRGRRRNLVEMCPGRRMWLTVLIGA